MQKYIFTTPVLIAVILSFIHAQPLWAQSELSETISGNVKGQRYETAIRISDITNSLIWLTNQDNPPLAVRSAERLAIKELAASLGDISGWSPLNINLSDHGDRHWIYDIRFRGPTYYESLDKDKLRPRESGVSVFVTMSGKAIGPKPWP